MTFIWFICNQDIYLMTAIIKSSVHMMMITIIIIIVRFNVPGDNLLQPGKFVGFLKITICCCYFPTRSDSHKEFY